MVCVHPNSFFIQRIAAASVGQPAYLWKRMLPYLIFSSYLARFTKYLRLGIKDFLLWKKMLYLTPIKDVYQVIGGFLFHPEKAVASQGQNWNHPEIICEPCFGCMPKVLQYPTFNVQVNFKFCFWWSVSGCGKILLHQCITEHSTNSYWISTSFMVIAGVSWKS